MKKTIKKHKLLTFIVIACVIIFGGKALQKSSFSQPSSSTANNVNAAASNHQIKLREIPEYSGKPYITINENQPNFSADELSSQSFERYSPLDALGRCGVAVANLGTETMPTSKREPIGQVKPSGWQTVKYPNVEGKYLYNRCHLIGFQLSGENANPRNLITGTRYLNVNGMLPFENLVADYIKETGNHVLYRVTPLYAGADLVAKGVLMEGESCEDRGAGVKYSVFVYNVQPGIHINYATGRSRLVDANQTAPRISSNAVYQK